MLFSVDRPRRFSPTILCVFFLAVQIDALYMSLLPRPVRFQRDIGNFQQSRDLFTASIQAARSIAQGHEPGFQPENRWRLALQRWRLRELKLT